jgi:hypothetical protein
MAALMAGLAVVAVVQVVAWRSRRAWWAVPVWQPDRTPAALPARPRTMVLGVHVIPGEIIHEAEAARGAGREAQRQ